MRGLVLFVAGILVGLGVQSTLAQNQNDAGVVLNHVGLSVPPPSGSSLAILANVTDR